MGNSGKSLCPVLILITAFSSLMLIGPISNVLAQINVNEKSVSGTINQNYTWITGESPYVFTGQVTVSAGVTLIILPGVTLNQEGYPLDIEGTLRAIGTPNNTITITGGYQSVDRFEPSSPSWNQTDNSGSIIQNAIISGTPINVWNTSPKIDNCQINWGGIAVDGSLIISNNKFSGGVDSYFGAIGVDNGDPVIFANEFDGNGYLTAIIVSSSDPCDISENLFSSCSSGVKVQAADGLLISNNSFI